MNSYQREFGNHDQVQPIGKPLNPRVGMGDQNPPRGCMWYIQILQYPLVNEGKIVMYCTKGGMVSINEQRGGRVYLHKIKKEKKKAGISQVGVGAWVIYILL